MVFFSSVTYKAAFWARLFLYKNWKLTLNPSNANHVELHLDRIIEIDNYDIVSVRSSKGLIWYSVEIRSRNRIDVLAGLNASKSQSLCDDLLTFINKFLAQRIEAGKAYLIEIDATLHSLTRDSLQYLAHADVSKAVSCIDGDVAKAISHPLFDVKLIPNSLSSQFPSSLAILTDPAIRHRYNEVFVDKELSRYCYFFDNLGGISLSEEQRQACIRLEDNNLLVASAGSGKTATMVGKVAYVLNKNLYRPEEILILAFNAGAAAELKQRIAHQLGTDEDALGCRVSTFHALGRGIIELTEGHPPQLANWVEHPMGETNIIKELIKNEIDQSPDFLLLWTELLLLFPKADLPFESFSSELEYQRYIADFTTGNSSSISSLSGVFVKSLQEKTIANWLWLNSVAFKYEKQFSFLQVDGSRQFVNTDFYYLQTKTLHEHFAIDKDGNSPFQDYVKHAQAKREGYKQGEFDFFETTSAMASDASLLKNLQTQLQKRGITFLRRSQQEIDEALKPAVIKRFHKLIGVCIKHIRSSHLTLDMLLERAKTLNDPVRAKHFARIVWTLSQAYQKKLTDVQKIDFESMIGDAVNLIETGRYLSPYSLILVDEFQDISEPRANLIKALKHQKPFTKVFAVGDDWQSIYRFAGSDISIFTRFQTHFGVSWQGKLENTYRCNQLIASTAATFVQRNPEQLKKTVHSTREAISRSIRIVHVALERGGEGMSKACLKILTRLNAYVNKAAELWQTEQKIKLKVLILSRYNSTNPYKFNPPIFSHLDVVSRTFHRSKGLEADYTLLLDVSEDNYYGVPSQIEDDELINLVIPLPETFPYSEERRLFYVALTRAIRGVYILTNPQRPSRYILELQEIAGADVQFESVDGKIIESCPSCLLGFKEQVLSKEGKHIMGCSRSPICKYESLLT